MVYKEEDKWVCCACGSIFDTQEEAEECEYEDDN